MKQITLICIVLLTLSGCVNSGYNPDYIVSEAVEESGSVKELQ